MGRLKIGGTVERVNGKELSYAEFVNRYMERNEPVIITGLMDDWRARKDWVLPDGRPNLHFFSSYFGHSNVQVADCGTPDFSDQKRVEMPVSQFIDHWLHNLSEDRDNATTKVEGRSLYLKDWHFVKEFPDYSAYTTPIFFHDDWLNLYLDQYHMHEDVDAYLKNNDISCSDYRFVYMGAKGTWTPCHADVFRSYSWSANVCGKKQWYLLPPGQSHLLFDRNMKRSVYDLLEDVSKKTYPGFEKAIWLECMQEKNEIFFVPSGWYHQVHNLEDTISINHNWFNAHNLSWVWDLLLRDYDEAKEYIEDIKDECDDFEGLCQRNLAANTGMNFYDFYYFVVRFSLANLVLLHHLSTSNICTFWSSSPRAKHIISNLEAARKILLKMELSCLNKHHSILADFRKNLEDPKFLRLCSHLEITYTSIHEPYKERKELEDDLVMVDLRERFRPLSCSHDDIISLVDSSLQNLKSYS